ncbi:hypothetical protein PJ311_17400 [Bacillus sp. CLL-7-23]|uniref:ABM domain-containing protein n=1 Tax=Bacillus changyiensis TaxID=3004103 RepID=A0ABT4X7S0_9BACI|nr:hypothetical protein [Bacillus changyiensis]MDA7028321.1 hypothetical protein [Bacillus changyiensis]
MEQVNQQYVMEMVLFKLREGTNKRRFCHAAATLTEALQTEMPGFKGRTLLHTPDETQWTDIIYWSNMDVALTAMDQLRSFPAFQTFVSMIDSREIMLRHFVPANLSM